MKGWGNERLPRGNGWLTMHRVEALVRTHTHFIDYIYIHPYTQTGSETRAAYALHLGFIHIRMNNPKAMCENYAIASSETEC